jgi:hypothetical protein
MDTHQIAWNENVAKDIINHDGSNDETGRSGPSRTGKKAVRSVISNGAPEEFDLLLAEIFDPVDVLDRARRLSA